MRVEFVDDPESGVTHLLVGNVSMRRWPNDDTPPWAVSLREIFDQREAVSREAAEYLRLHPLPETAPV